MSQTAIYQTAATSTGEGRNGRSRTVDGILDVALATPKELGGEGGATNPEQLFAAGYAACFHSALKLVARKMRVPVEDSAVTAEVLYDAVSLVTNTPGSFGGLPTDKHAPNRAIMLPDEAFPSYFLDVFGRDSVRVAGDGPGAVPACLSLGHLGEGEGDVGGIFQRRHAGKRYR